MKRFALVISSIIYLPAIFAQPAKLPVKKHGLVVIAHRGDHTAAPENTLTAYRNAISHGVDYVEIDLRTAKDGSLVIMHDASIDRMTNGHGAVRDFTLPELKNLVVADKAHPQWAAETIPSFEEVLSLCRNKAYIYLDFKDASVRACLDAIRNFGMERSIVVYINSAEQYHQWHVLAPEMPLMLSLPDSARTVQSLTAFLQNNAISVLDGSADDYTLELAQAAKKMGMQVWPDIQSPEESATTWSEALFKGFAGLQTDHPKQLIEFLLQKKIR